MTISTSNGKRFVDIGSSEMWNSLCSTIIVRLDYFKGSIPDALDFLKTGKCSSNKATETARQFNLIRDEFSKFTPDMIVYDQNDIKKEAPWKDNISNVITSCANFYTTADGGDLLYEIVSILTYAGILKNNVSIT